MDENSIGKEIVDAAIEVHRELGPGLLETVYEVVLRNFDEDMMKHDITRTVNSLPE